MYRRIRYIRYKRRIHRKIIHDLKTAAIQEREEVKRKLLAYKKQESIQQRHKRREDKELSREIRAAQRSEIREKKKHTRNEIKKISKKIRQNKHLQHKIERKERRRLLRQFVRIQIRNLKHLPHEVNAKNIRRLFSLIYDTILSVKSYLIISFNSTVLFVLSYLTLFLIGQFVTVLAASFFNYPTMVYYYEVYFIISPADWYHDSVKTIFSAGPLVNLVIGFSFLIIYNNIRENTGSFKLFFLWGYLHAVNMLFGAMLVGTLFETGIGHVISWMYIGDTGRVLYSIISIFILVVAGLVATRPFLISANTYFNSIGSRNRAFFIFSQVVLPYILGNVFLVTIRLPRLIYYDTFIVITLILSIIPILIAQRAYPELYFEEDAKQHRIAWKNGIILAIIVLFFRGLLEVGIRFGG